MSSKLRQGSVLSSGPMQMPVVGLGTWQASSDEEIECAITTAIEAGYRHIDTAYHYENEKAIGKALKKLFNAGKIKRQDLFIVTKLPLIAMRNKYVEPYLKRSLEALQLDYVDLYLIHHPIGLKNMGEDIHFPKDEDGKLLLDLETNHVTLWKAMEVQVDAGTTKSIGLSNFNINQIQRILENNRLPISNLQVELHIYLQQKKLVSFCKENNITMCAYAPLGSPGLAKGIQKITGTTEGLLDLSPLTEPVINEIANQHKKLPSQVLLRYILECGHAVIPKSANPQRIKQNIDIFDFELTKDDCEKISALDRDEKGRIFNNLGVYKDMMAHPEYPYPKIIA